MISSSCSKKTYNIGIVSCLLNPDNVDVCDSDHLYSSTSLGPTVA